MGVQIPINEAQISLLFTCVGSLRQAVTTFGVAPANAATPVVTIGTDVRALYISAGLGIASAFSSSWTWNGVYVQKMTGAGIQSATVGSPVTGSATANTVPMNGAVLIRKGTNLGGRQNKGRMYWPPVAFNESIVSPAGIIASAELAAEQTKWTAFWNSLLTGDYPMVLFHSDGSPSTIVNGLTLQNKLATQRRRLR